MATTALTDALAELKLQKASRRDSPSFPHAFVINLDQRTDRWARISESFKTAGLTYERVPAIRHEKGWVGCGKSHLLCVDLAKSRQLPWALIVEDDSDFQPENIDDFRQILPRLWANRADWEIFNCCPHFGAGPLDPHLSLYDIDDHLIYCRAFASHFYLIHQNSYDSILRYNPPDDRQIDVFYFHGAVNANGPIRTICSYPHIAHQSDSLSDVTPSTQHNMRAYSRHSASTLLDFIETISLEMTKVIKVPARHPNWRGELCLSRQGSVMQFGSGNFAKYRFVDEYLEINWYRYGRESFTISDDGNYIEYTSSGSRDMLRR